MAASFPELVVGGVLVAPFVVYAAVAFAVTLLMRPVLRRLRLDRVVSNPPLVMVSLYVVVLACLVVAL